jgi:hypothetical protein
MRNMKLKDILLEQSSNTRSIGGKFNPAKVAQKIYSAKANYGKNLPNSSLPLRTAAFIVNSTDDEQLAINATLSIKSLDQYNRVEQEFVKLSKGDTIPDHLFSFLDNFRQNHTVLKHLYSISKNNPLALQYLIYPYAADLLYEYKSAIRYIGYQLEQKKPISSLPQIGRSGQYSSKYYKWFKPYLGEANWEKWDRIIADPEFTYNSYFNPYKQEEQFKYDSYKQVSSGMIFAGELVVGTIASILSAGFGAPSVIGWLAMSTEAGLELYDASQEYNLGNKETAGLMAALSVLPFVSKVPGVKQLINKVGNSLSNKLVTGLTNLTSEERYVADMLVKNANEVAMELQELDKSVKANIGELPLADDFNLGQGNMNLQKLYGLGDKSAIAVYGKEVAENPTVFFALADKYNLSNYISYQHVVRNGKPGYYLSMNTKMITAAPGSFKTLMTNLSKILPDHKLFEKTSISTDGITMWNNQIKAGYKPLTETFTVPINNAGRKIKLGGAGIGFDNALFNTQQQAEIAKQQIEELISGIPNSKVEIIAPKVTPLPPKIPGQPPILASPKLGTSTTKSVTGSYTLKVTLPVLQSTTTSLNILGILPTQIFPKVLADLKQKE